MTPDEFEVRLGELVAQHGPITGTQVRNPTVRDRNDEETINPAPTYRYVFQDLTYLDAQGIVDDTGTVVQYTTVGGTAKPKEPKGGPLPELIPVDASGQDVRETGQPAVKLYSTKTGQFTDLPDPKAAPQPDDITPNTTAEYLETRDPKTGVVTKRPNPNYTPSTRPKPGDTRKVRDQIGTKSYWVTQRADAQGNWQDDPSVPLEPLSTAAGVAVGGSGGGSVAPPRVIASSAGPNSKWLVLDNGASAGRNPNYVDQDELLQQEIARLKALSDAGLTLTKRDELALADLYARAQEQRQQNIKQEEQFRELAIKEAQAEAAFERERPQREAQARRAEEQFGLQRRAEDRAATQGQVDVLTRQSEASQGLMRGMVSAGVAPSRGTLRAAYNPLQHALQLMQSMAQRGEVPSSALPTPAAATAPGAAAPAPFNPLSRAQQLMQEMVKRGEVPASTLPTPIAPTPGAGGAASAPGPPAPPSAPAPFRRYGIYPN